MKTFFTAVLVMTMISTLAGCAFRRTTANISDTGRFSTEMIPQETRNSLSEKAPSVDTVYESIDELTLDQALKLALERNPGLAALHHEIRARKGRTVQAGLLPNPELGADLENVGGTGNFSGIGRSETTVSVSQQLLLGGKRGMRERVASLESDLAVWDYETARLDLINRVRKDFIDVQVAQELVNLGEELVHIAERFLETIRRRVETGRVSPVELVRAEAELSETQLEHARSRRLLTAARKRLAAAWGGTSVDFDQTVGIARVLSPLPPLEQLTGHIAENPDLARWEAEIEQRRAVVRLEDARRIPDPSVAGGYRLLNEDDAGAFIVGVTVPLPLFDRNQGGRLEARARLEQAEELRRQARLDIVTELAAFYELLSGSYTDAIIIRDNILPGAEDTYDTIQEGYQQGRFTFLEVLDAQRALFSSHSRYLKALGDYQRYLADLERLIVHPISELG